jgi:transmembrane sensor
MESRERAESAAATWIARRERDDWSGDDQVQLDAWINASTDNRVAWLRVSAAWQQTSRLRSLTTSAAHGTVPARDNIHMPFFDSGGTAGMPSPTSSGKVPHRTHVRARALAGAVVLAVAAIAAWYVLRVGPSYQTEIGALQAVSLTDGSKVTLDTNTRIHVDVTQTERRVDLEQGEAYFEVAKDLARPFVVIAGDKRIVAVGTQFSVRNERGEVRVIVTEGSVQVERGTGDTTRHMMQLQAGSIARAGPDAVLVEEQPISELEQLLSWRTGHLSFDDSPLADAVAEFNRYNTRKIVILDPAVAAIRIGGNFRATNIDAFVRLIASDFPITVTPQGQEIVLAGKPALEK